MHTNKVKQKLRRGELVVGSFNYIPSARLAEIMALIGFDFVVIDQEHGPIGSETAEDMVRACEASGTTPLVRVSHNTDYIVLQALDMGAQGVHIPNVSTREQALEALSYTKYAPLGKRGLAGVRAAEYGFREKLVDYCARANEEILTVVHIEDIEAVNNIEQLLGVEGIDVYYLGPLDLSQSMNLPGQTGHPDVVKAVEGCIERIVGMGKVAGVITVEPEAARRYVKMGVRYLATHALRFMVDASRTFLKSLGR